MNDFLTVSQIVQSLALAVAIIVGGLWTLYRFGLQRSFETGLAIETTTTLSQVNEAKFVVFLDVLLTNTGNRALRARQNHWKAGTPMPIYTRRSDPVYYGLGVQFRAIDLAVADVRVVTSLDSPGVVEVPGVPSEISLLHDYEAKLGGKVLHNFFLEPGEKYHFGIALTLSPGHYLAHVQFFGSRGLDEYWSRLAYFQLSAT